MTLTNTETVSNMKTASKTEKVPEVKTISNTETMPKAKSVIVIGAGASGLMAAVTAAGNAAEVTLIDGNDKVGRKLYATGHGHCNFTNVNCSAADYNAADDGFVESVLSRFSAAGSIDFFRENGMLAREEDEGRCYPYSGQAATLVDVFWRKAVGQCVRMVLSDRVASVERSDSGHFAVICDSGQKYEAEALIIACGGRAGMKFGSTGDGYGFARTFGHTLTPPRPALVAAVAESSLHAKLKLAHGVRAKGRITLLKDGNPLTSEEGEIQFAEDGISGICMFDISRHMQVLPPPKNKKGKAPSDESGQPDYVLSIDLLPEMEVQELADLLEDFAQKCDFLTDVLGGIINSKLALMMQEEIIAFSGVSPANNDGSRQVSIVNSRNDKNLWYNTARLLKEFKVKVAATRGWNDAQVTSGGVKRSEIEAQTMQSLLVPNLYFCGEVIDVDGRCGGYNLQWAWSSGYTAGLLQTAQTKA